MANEGPIRQALIKRHDEQPIAAWTAIQKIKNQLFGPLTWAVQLFPAADEVIDAANIYHLWILPERPPFGMYCHLIDNVARASR